VFNETQHQRRRQPGDAGQQADNHNRAQELNVAAAHGVDRRFRY